MCESAVSASRPAGCCRVWMVMMLLLLLLSIHPAAPSVCHGPCDCAIDIISCLQRNLSSPPTPLPRYAAQLDLSFNCIGRLRSDWTTVRLSGLHTLLLSHNGLYFLSPEAFVQVRRLKRLDLSSNALTHLDEFVFEPLPHLEVLMLYDNKISQIDRMAFSGLLGLQKLYLGQNRVSRFPLELLKDRNRLEKLRLLDVSSNRIRALPLVDLQVLPTWLKNNIYFHSNPLDCSCDLYSVLTGWQQRELRPVYEFPESHSCLQPVSRAKASVLQLNCSAVRVQDEEAFLNQILILDCDTRYREVTKTWMVPPLVDQDIAQPLGDGRLQVGPLRAEDSGEYRCVVEGDGVNETLVVTVKVHNSTQGFGDSLNTAYTTLACCVFTVVLVVIYLYFIPCPCNPHGTSNLTDSIHSSSPSITNTFVQQGALLVGFCEPKDQISSIKNNKEEEDDEGWRKEHKDRKRQDSITSDMPIVV